MLMLSFALGPDLTKTPALLVRLDGTLLGDSGYTSVAGFVERLDSATVDISFDDFEASPERVLGTYVLLADAHGFLSANLAVVERVTRIADTDRT